MKDDLRYCVQRSGNETRGGSEGVLGEDKVLGERDWVGLPGSRFVPIIVEDTFSAPGERWLAQSPASG